ncbi:TPA: hypothetical protein ACTXXA_002015 [Legionella anisa]
MKIWQSVVAATFLLFPLSHAHAIAFTNNITDFPQLVQAVESGNDVRAIIHFDDCDVTGPELSAQAKRRLNGATTRFNFTQFFHGKEEIDDNLIDTVTTSMKIFIKKPSGEFVTFSGRLSVFEDNTATLHVDFFDPVLKKQKFVVDWFCRISNGHDSNGLVLFNFS